MLILLCLLVIIHIIQNSTELDNPSCFSPVYCDDKLLHTVQTIGLFEDSKQFVDMKMKFEIDEVLKNFRSLMKENWNRPTKRKIQRFVKHNFEDGDELDLWYAEDYSPDPSFLKKILIPSYKEFAKNLIPIWKILGRKIKSGVIDEKNDSRFSIIPVPNGFIIPGGRFREFYYWDSYWIIVGLLHSGMSKTVKGMLDNFIWMVKTYGFIPNGGRIYYLNRSQPPLFLMMVHEYLKYNVDKENEWLKQNLPVMEMELSYWLNNKTITFSMNNIEYTLARYNVNSSSPRPESYHEDLATCSFHKDDNARNKCYRELKTGAESGWDFSSRWMTENLKLYDMKTSEIAPVDLNAFLTRSFYIMAQLFLKTGNEIKYNQWLKVFEKWNSTLHKIMYNEEDGIWYDFDLVEQKQNRQFFCSNFAPLWAQLYTEPKIAETLGDKAVAYLLNNKIMTYHGGIPTSLYQSGEQWDLPNAWPNLQSIVILGLYRSGSRKAQNIAKTLAQRWIDANLELFKKTNSMFEKYNVEYIGEPGNGGEYEVQTGFGWSNGVILELIVEFFSSKDATDEKDAKDEILTGRTSGCANMFGIFNFLLVLLFSGLIYLV